MGRLTPKYSFGWAVRIVLGVVTGALAFLADDVGNLHYSAAWSIKAGRA